MSDKWVGQRMPRLEDEALLTGRARFIDDLEPAAGLRHAAILRSHVKMAALTLRGLNDDIAALKLNSRVFAAHGNANFGALIHFHQRAISQAEHGMRSATGANSLPFGDFVAHLEWLITVVPNAIQDAAHRLHAGAHSLRTGEELILDKVSGDGKNHDCRRSSNPAKAGIPDLWKLMLPRRKRATLALAAFGFTTANRAFMQMGFHQQGTG